jgi:hypothetical protein
LTHLRARNDRGAAPLEVVVAMFLLTFLVLGVTEVAFALYARNVVAASAHEGARAAVELGRSPGDAAGVARETVEKAAGGVVDDLHVAVSTRDVGEVEIIHVSVEATLQPFGPIPLPMRVDTSSTATRELVAE